MKFSLFFIDHPIFAMALSIVIVLAGAVSYLTLPVAQYPEIVPPTPASPPQLAASAPLTWAQPLSEAP